LNRSSRFMHIKPLAPLGDLSFCRHKENPSRCLCWLNLQTPCLSLEDFTESCFLVVVQRVRICDFKAKGRVLNTRDGYGGKGGKELVIFSEQGLVFSVSNGCSHTTHRELDVGKV